MNTIPEELQEVCATIKLFQCESLIATEIFLIHSFITICFVVVS